MVMSLWPRFFGPPCSTACGEANYDESVVAVLNELWRADESRCGDERDVPAGTAAGHQHVGARLLPSRPVPGLGAGCTRRRQRHHRRAASSLRQLGVDHIAKPGHESTLNQRAKITLI